MVKGRKKIGFKMSVIFIAFALLLGASITVFNYYMTWRSYVDIFGDKIEQTVSLAVKMTDGDRLGAYNDPDDIDDYYIGLREQYNMMKQELGVDYLYIFRPEDGYFTYLLEAQLESDDPDYIAKLGDTYEYTETELTYLVPTVESATALDEPIVAYSFMGDGNGVSTWGPVLDSEGRLVAMVEADIYFDVVMNQLNSHMLTNIVIIIGLLLVMVTLLLVLTSRILTKPLSQLTGQVMDFASGEKLRSYENSIKTGDEMQALSEAFVKMAGDIDRYTLTQASVAADKERMSTEMNLATDIQSSMLPDDFFSDNDSFELFAFMQPSRVIGGDFYDFFFIDEKRLCVIVANVSGRGVPAALFMVIAKTMIKNQMLMGGGPAEAFTALNTQLFDSSAQDMSVETFVGVLDTDDGSFSYINAGHISPLVMKNGGRYEWLETQKTAALAQTRNVVYRQIDTRLKQGDRLLLYTEGVIAAKNAQGEALGAERLRSMANAGRNREQHLSQMLGDIRVQVDEYRDGEQNDDMTMLVIEYRKGDKAQSSVSIPAGGRPEEAVAFLKKQLAENKLGGKLYANLAVVTEELYALLSASCRAGGRISLRVSVSGGTVELMLSAPGESRDFTAEELPQLSFVRKVCDRLEWEYTGGENALIATKLV